VLSEGTTGFHDQHEKTGAPNEQPHCRPWSPAPVRKFTALDYFRNIAQCAGQAARAFCHDEFASPSISPLTGDAEIQILLAVTLRHAAPTLALLRATASNTSRIVQFGRPTAASGRR